MKRNVHVDDIVNEAEKWDDVETLVLASNTVVVKNLRNSAFARMVLGYTGDCDVEVTETWDGDGLKIVFGQ